jgi:hypothetical protein
MMINEKPGGHGERSVADRHHRHGGVGRGRQDRRQAAVPAAGRALRHGTPDRKVFVYAAGGYYYPGKDDERS